MAMTLRPFYKGSLTLVQLVTKLLLTMSVCTAVVARHIKRKAKVKVHRKLAITFRK